jgi:hypothetical protein
MPERLTGRCHCGKHGWTFDVDPGSATACNCTLCRRYGALWAYDYEGEGCSVSDEPASYRRAGVKTPSLEILFCPTCAAVLAWRGLRLDDAGRRRMAVNLRLAEPETVAHLPIDHFDGLVSFDDLPRDERCIRDMWF